jgi:hypothetical protein
MSPARLPSVFVDGGVESVPYLFSSSREHDTPILEKE